MCHTIVMKKISVNNKPMNNYIYMKCLQKQINTNTTQTYN